MRPRATIAVRGAHSSALLIRIAFAPFASDHSSPRIPHDSGSCGRKLVGVPSFAEATAGRLPFRTNYEKRT